MDEQLNPIIRDATNKGLISFQSRDWLTKAIAQHPERVTLELAHSKLDAKFACMDMMDFYIMFKENWAQN